ncbi:MAG: hypothetical protein M3Y81_21730 [Chloroflexota bacterium]|nr:hypothetical protein [Chloroflexota bacterium]
MDAIQFGQWISKHRRMCGWNSQRALIATVRRDPKISKMGISEDFLARLEAGHLQHPFRGTTRQRVIALAYLLCKTPRDVQAYQRAAELNDLNAEETERFAYLTEILGARPSPVAMLLPPRPTRLIGRAAVLQDVMRVLREGEPGIYALTGMPGVGKSALAAEVVHLLSTESNRYRRVFPHGIITLSGKGCTGTTGLITFLNKVADILGSPARRSPDGQADGQIHVIPGLTDTTALNTALDASLAIDRTRTFLAGKRALLLLDDLDPHFPLRLALDALLVHGYRNEEADATSENFLTGCTMLVTSRSMPSPGNMTYHLHLDPLDKEAALELFTALVNRPLSNEELVSARQICAALGELPHAIELAASAVRVGTSCSLLATQLAAQPLDPLLDSEGDLYTCLEQAHHALPADMREPFIRLATLGTQPFSLEQAATTQVPLGGWTQIELSNQLVFNLPLRGLTTSNTQDNAPSQHEALVGTATILTHLVRHSLVELLPYNALATPPVSQQITGTRSAGHSQYRLHPLLHAYADMCQRKQHADTIAYAEQYQEDMLHLGQQRERLLTTLAQLWYNRQYDQVVRLVGYLLQFVGRLRNQQGEHILLCGIQASQQIHDRFHMARFLNRLGRLRMHRGDFDGARQAWETSLEIAQSIEASRSFDHRVQLLKPWVNLSLLATEIGDHAAARHYAQIYLEKCQMLGDLSSIIDGFLELGWASLYHGDRATAEQAVRNAANLCSAYTSTTTSSCARLLVLEVQYLLAYVQNDYRQSQKYLEELVTLVNEGFDPYGIAALLLDQAMFAQTQQLLDEARALVLRSIKATAEIEAPMLYARALALLQQLPATASSVGGGR